jgi:hypothetical protein
MPIQDLIIELAGFDLSLAPSERPDEMVVAQMRSARRALADRLQVDLGYDLRAWLKHIDRTKELREEYKHPYAASVTRQAVNRAIKSRARLRLVTLAENADVDSPFTQFGEINPLQRNILLLSGYSLESRGHPSDAEIVARMRAARRELAGLVGTDLGFDLKAWVKHFHDNRELWDRFVEGSGTCRHAVARASKNLDRQRLVQLATQDEASRG